MVLMYMSYMLSLYLYLYSLFDSPREIFCTEGWLRLQDSVPAIVGNADEVAIVISDM